MTFSDNHIVHKVHRYDTVVQHKNVVLYDNTLYLSQQSYNRT
jgi:hypothetical protein